MQTSGAVRQRLKSATGRLLRALGLVLVFAAMLAPALVLHLDVAATRRLGGRALVALLNRTLQGRFELDQVSELSLVSLLADGFRVRDPQGRVVLEGHGIRVRASVPAIVRELLSGDAKTTIVIEYGRVERASVVLAPVPGQGELGLVLAFTPRKAASTPGAPAPRVWLPTLELGRGSAHAELPGLPPLDAEVTGARGQVLVSPVGVAVDAARFSAVVRGLLAQELRAVGSFHERGTSHFWSSLDGYAGDLQFDSIVRLDGHRLAVTLDVPRGEPKAVRALLPAWPLEQTASGHLEAAGELPKLDAKATASVGAAVLGARGSIELSPELRLKLTTEGKDIDLRALFPSAPETRIAARAVLDLAAKESGVELTTDGATEPGVVGMVPLPATTFHAHYDQAGLSGTATLAEPGMPLSGSFSLEPKGALVFDVRAPRFALEAAPRLAGAGARGHAQFKAQGRLEQRKLEATLAADLDGVELGAWRVRRAHVAGRVQGSVDAPRGLRLDASLDGEGLKWGALAFDDASAKLAGPLERLALTAKLTSARGATIAASTTLRALGGTELSDVDVVIAREGMRAHGTAARIALAGDSLEVAGVKLEGSSGTLTGSGRYRPGLLEIDARGQNLDLGNMAHLLGVASPKLAGKLDVKAEVALARDVRRGSLSVSVRHGVLGPYSDLNLDFATTLDGERLEGNALLDATGIAKVQASFDTTVEGSLLDATAWRRATGRLDLGLERLELARVAPLLPPGAELRSLGGVAMVQVSLTHEVAEEPPSVALLFATDGLVLERGQADGSSLRISGIEAQASGNIDGPHGYASLNGRLVDEHGLLLTLSSRLDLDVRRLLGAPGELGWLREQPLVATAVIDDRPLDELPIWVRPGFAHGALRLETSVRGSFAAPVLAARVALGGLTFGDTLDQRPFDLCGTLQYDPLAQKVGLGAQAHLPGSGVACSGTRVAVARATGTLHLPLLLRGERGFDGDAELGLEDAPLALLPPLAAAGMAGRARGAIALDMTSELPALQARLELSEILVRSVPVGSGELELSTDGRAVTAKVELARGGGRLDAEARAGLTWARAWPELDAGTPFELEAAIHDIDAALLSPVVGGVLADLSGELDGHVHLTLAPPSKPAAGGAVSELSGELALKNGALQLSGLGMRLSNVKFNAVAKKSAGRTVIAVRGLSAASGAKYDNVAATADVYLDGLRLTDARANVNLKKVPLLIEGVSQATLTGAAALELFPDRDPMLVAIQLHDFTAELPRSSGRSVLSVDDNPDIVVKQPLREPTGAARAGSLRWELAFDLASKVKLTRADMDIPLKGRPVVALGESTSVRGDLELQAGGHVELLGKGFLIESGEVHFDTGDPSNPHLHVLSSWRAPEGTTVDVELGGTLREATLRLSSDPALPPAEIQALLLGGGSGEGGEARAAGVGYGADFVGSLLADTPLKRVELRTGSETSADERSYLTYTAAVPVSENVWVELSYKNLAGNSPAASTDAASATVDWRFKRDWSLRTEAGTIGTGLDLLWQYRY